MNKKDSERILIERLFEDSIKKGAIEKKTIKSLVKLAGDASSRKYYRLETSQQSYIVCLDSPFESLEHYPFLRIQKFLNERAVRVPLIYDFSGKEGYLLEEDLGDTTLIKHSYNFTKEDELSYYKRCLDEIIKIHLTPNDEALDICQGLSFDLEKYSSELDFTINHFFKFLLSEVYLLKNIDIIESIRNDFLNILEEISKYEKVLTHRDFHSRNIMLKENDLVLIDFQDARLGIPQYDLVSLLEDCYYELSESNINNLKKYYFSNISSLVSDQGSYKEFLKIYDFVLIQRVFKALGSFSYLYNKRNDNRYLKYIGFGMEKLKKVFMKYESFSQIRKNLFYIYYEN